MSPPSLPVEITDFIVDILVEDPFPEWYAHALDVANLAHVSHIFRNRINHHRFAKIAIHHAHRISDTYELLENDDVWGNDADRIHAHTKIFEVILIEPERTLDLAFTRHSFEMEFLLNNVLKKYPAGKAPDIAPSFIWDVKVETSWCNKHFFDWTSMSHGMQSAFRNMLQESRLGKLCIASLQNIPQDLIHACPIPELHFTDVSFTDPPLPPKLGHHTDKDVVQHVRGILSPWHLQHATSFATDHSTSVSDFFGAGFYNTGRQLTPIFPNVDTLVCCICNEDEFGMTTTLMRHAKNAKFVSIGIYEPMKLPRSIAFNTFTNLETLHLTYYGALRPLAPDYPEYVRNVINPLLPSIPSVQRLGISLIIFSTNDYTVDLDRIFEGHDFTPIDEFLSDRPPASLKAVEIFLEVVLTTTSAFHAQSFYAERFNEEGGRYAQDALFPQLAGLGRPELKITLVPMLHGSIDVEHYSSSPHYRWSYADGGIVPPESSEADSDSD
ncbi:hypothetical protein BDN70DRAFT_930743 [Pholiota conissans]|uniref:Uncharacterized protein n=1 Tax=Pholiota conissans TaxID=109636 RepID=A0A9P6D3H9_9AGAR|nr:hypothetical protein BDN70DRAFT_930743 [Pholiota conissans]